MTTRKERRLAREERKREESHRKRAVKVLESYSQDDSASVEWAGWAKMAADSMARGYNLQWKMGFKGSPKPKSISEFLKNEVPYTPDPEEVSISDFLKKVNK